MILNGMEDEELTHFEFTDDELKELYWEHSEEFEFNGIMYDVVRRSYRQGKWELICWKDVKESAENQALDKLISNLLYGASKKNQKKQLDRLSLSLFIPKSNVAIIPPKIISKKQSYFYVPIHYQYKNSPPTPPPQFI
ncbi:hypothetical protein [Crocinitomix algicola]|uniref:hypothetical protein n=1 Tax=Crocinitomix algicola TaxID=1740263 RepID=UPI000872311F|nr:hypothetical protein [Crocinitomix algicola]